MFGLTGDDVPKGEWNPVELPDKGVKVEHSSCDNTGSFCLVVSDKGVVYFSGTNKQGESGEGAFSSPPPPPPPPPPQSTHTFIDLHEPTSALQG